MKRSRRFRLLLYLVALLPFPLLVLYVFLGTTALYRLGELLDPPESAAGVDGVVVYLDGDPRPNRDKGLTLHLMNGDKKPCPLTEAAADKDELLSGPALSRDGRMLAYVVEFRDCFRVVDTPKRQTGPSRATYQLVPERANRRVFVQEMGGTQTMDLSRGLADDIEPEWSPDAKLIAFSSGERTFDDPSNPCTLRPHLHQIWVMDPHGDNRRPVTDLPTQCFHPTWSPDSKQIAFIAASPFHIRAPREAIPPVLEEARRHFLCELWVINSDGTRPRQLTRIGPLSKSQRRWLTTNPYDLPSAWEPRWSPVGDDIVLVFKDQLFLCNAKDGQLKQLTRLDPDMPRDHPLGPCWSPDGQSICFAYHRYAGRRPFSDSYEFTNDLYLIGRNGSRLRRLTSTRFAWEPSWGPECSPPQNGG